jgi:hypothetical protein
MAKTTKDDPSLAEQIADAAAENTLALIRWSAGVRKTWCRRPAP